MKGHALSRVHKTSLAKICVAIFVLEATVVILAVHPSEFQTFAIPVVGFNLATSLALGWIAYRYVSHLEFYYDDQGFRIKKGRRKVTGHSWSEFSRVSLVRSEALEFSVRLYSDGGFFEIPASRLKLDPFKFRFEVLGLLRGARK